MNIMNYTNLFLLVSDARSVNPRLIDNPIYNDALFAIKWHGGIKGKLQQYLLDKAMKQEIAFQSFGLLEGESSYIYFDYCDQ